MPDVAVDSPGIVGGDPRPMSVPRNGVRGGGGRGLVSMLNEQSRAGIC